MHYFDENERQQQKRMAMDYAAQLASDNKWITVKPNGPDHKGTPVEIDDSGRVTKGMGGKFKGEKIGEVRKDFSGPHTPTGEQKQAANKPTGFPFPTRVSKPPAPKLDDAQRERLAQSQELWQKYGEKKEGGRGLFKASARSGELDHLWGEYEAPILAAKTAQAKKQAASAKAKETLRAKKAEAEAKAQSEADATPYETPAGHESLTKPLKIERETDKAYGVRNQAYHDALETFHYDPKELTPEERDLLTDGQSLRWIPKSVAGVHGQHIRSMTDWFAQKEGYAPRKQQDHTYLNVPYAEKDAAKQLGARWDAQRGKWYVPAGTEVHKDLEKYLPQASASAGASKPSGSAGHENAVSMAQPRRSPPKYGVIDGDDPSLWGSELLGREGDSWQDFYRTAAGQKFRKRLGMDSSAIDTIALDRASVRSIDADGRLHIAVSNISKANVCGYFGREIPNAEALGLQPDKLYQLLRDPDELAKAASTFNNLPLLDEHIPVSADEPHKDVVVGSTGTDAEFDGTYLKNSLVVWDATAIAAINSGEQRELSAAYRYVADMTPGVFRGVPYDGVMRQIQGNHLAIVEIGRAGADVIVGDSQPMELQPMKIQKGKTGVVNAALCGHILPQMAQDANPIPQIRSLVAKATTVEQLAQDAAEAFEGIDMSSLAKLLKQVLAVEAKEPESDPAAENDETPDEDEIASDEDDEQDAKEQAESLQNGKAEEVAMDAAAIASRAEAAAMSKFKAIRAAERDVAPLVGEVVAMDSAADVYRFAMDSVGIDYTGVHASAYPALIKMHKTAQQPKQTARMGMDAAAKNALAALMPNAFGTK